MRVTLVFAACLLLAALFVGPATSQCPPLADFTSNAPCEYFCGIKCDYKGVTNVCICQDGYLKDPVTKQCVKESQCTMGADVAVYRTAGSFTFSCFQ